MHKCMYYNKQFLLRFNFNTLRPHKVDFLVFGFYAKKIFGRAGDYLILEFKKGNLKIFGRRKKRASDYILFLKCHFFRWYTCKTVTVFALVSDPPDR